MKATIVIPFYRGLKLLQNALLRLDSQITTFDYDILIINSSEIIYNEKLLCLSSKINVLSIDAKEFNHGATRNLAIKNTTSEFLIYTVQDAIPSSDSWLHNLIQPMIDNNLDAICGKQMVPHNSAFNPIEWSAPIDKPKLHIIQLPPFSFSELSPSFQRSMLMWDNVNAAYRREVLEQYPFDSVLFGEDLMWMKQALCAGLKVAYTGFSVVEHYHHYEGSFALKRFLAEFYIDKKVIGLDPIKPILKVRTLLSWIKKLSFSKLPLLSKYTWLLYNYRLFVSKKRAYKLWNTFMGIEDVEYYLANNIPQSSSND